MREEARPPATAGGGRRRATGAEVGGRQAEPREQTGPGRGRQQPEPEIEEEIEEDSE